MGKKLDSKLQCPKCNTIYLTLTQNVTLSSLVNCATCGTYLGTWAELESDFIAQGGENGVFEMREGQIIRKD
ncbi:hypothetical protein [Phyllobacterium brassicacearum]|uniref:hypothetical protein n=1 Tax=Phyllobacterium brassicacearum TaxID=314235 RepID=UPI00105D16C1|nr:hypothetical protein [Phyllobacterium brassicacearum]TDQ09138.1 hypothetical protein DEV91_1589 [Phyllobacterium brassicacearum]